MLSKYSCNMKWLNARGLICDHSTTLRPVLSALLCIWRWPHKATVEYLLNRTDLKQVVNTGISWLVNLYYIYNPLTPLQPSVRKAGQENTS